MPLVRINLEYLGKCRKFKEPSKQEWAVFAKKIDYIQKIDHAQFQFSETFKLAQWHGKPPGNPPDDLVEEVIDNGLFRFRLNQKFRVFAYKEGETYLVIWLDPTHVSGR